MTINNFGALAFSGGSLYSADDETLSHDSASNSVVVAIVLSSGEDGNLYGENSDHATDSIYIHNHYLVDENNNFKFDDQLVWVSKYTLAYHFVTAGKWP